MAVIPLRVPDPLPTPLPQPALEQYVFMSVAARMLGRQPKTFLNRVNKDPGAMRQWLRCKKIGGRWVVPLSRLRTLTEEHGP